MTAGVEVVPVLGEADLVDPALAEVNESDLALTFQRASGAGGQNVNKVETGGFQRLARLPAGQSVLSHVSLLVSLPGGTQVCLHTCLLAVCDHLDCLAVSCNTLRQPAKTQESLEQHGHADVIVEVIVWPMQDTWKLTRNPRYLLHTYPQVCASPTCPPV